MPLVTVLVPALTGIVLIPVLTVKVSPFTFTELSAFASITNVRTPSAGASNVNEVFELTLIAFVSFAPS